MLGTYLECLIEKGLHGLINGIGNLLDNFTAQILHQTFQSSFNESAEQLPQQGGIGEGLELSGLPVADLPVVQLAV